MQILKLIKRAGNMNFSHFYSVRQTCYAYNFFGAFLKNFFNGFEISIKFCIFLYLYQKSKRVLRKCVLDLNFAPIKWSVFLIC